MNARGFFLLLLLFTCSCFAWWMIQLEQLNRDLRNEKITALGLQAEKAHNQLIWKGSPDSTTEQNMPVNMGALTLYLNPGEWERTALEYPSLLFTREKGYASITPRLEALQEIRYAAETRQWQQIAESVLFFGLLLTGFVWIYRGLTQAIALNSQQNHFLVSVTHELKTPIASTKLLFETLRRHRLEDDKKEELCNAGLEDSARLLDLVESILIATRLENKEMEFLLHETDLSEWLHDELNRMQQDYHGNLNLDVHIEPGVLARLELVSFRLTLHNLIDNARKYGGRDNATGIRLFRKGKGIVLQVTDAGPGIPAGEKKKIFKKFYRSGDAHTRHHQGTGLGLFIVSETIKRHGGKVWVEDARPGGSIFNLLLPKP